jgi:hypothetical protein
MEENKPILGMSKGYNNNLLNWENLLIQNISLFNHGPTHNEDVIPIEYIKNDLGYRSQPFENQADILFLGDSYTRGDGLPEDLRYPYILSKKLNSTFSSLAVGGDSVVGQIAKCFYYFKNYGHPKTIVALFPMNRFSYPFLKGEMQNASQFFMQAAMLNVPSDKQNHVITADLYEDHLAKIAKAPYTPPEVISNKIAFFYDRMMLDMLEQYCETNNINFVWSVWNSGYQGTLFNQIEKKYPGYHKNYCWIDANSWFRREFEGQVITVPPEPWTEEILEKHINCHIELSDEFLYHIAADRVKSNGRGAHNGFHWHMHAADDFYNLIIKKSEK